MDGRHTCGNGDNTRDSTLPHLGGRQATEASVKGRGHLVVEIDPPLGKYPYLLDVIRFQLLRGS